MAGNRATGLLRATVERPVRWPCNPSILAGRLRRNRAGLTLVEVLVAAAILAVAALAALEFLASSDAAALTARREAMAAVEAERALAEAAELVRNGGDPTGRRTLDRENGGETLAGCTIEIRTLREARDIGTVFDGPVAVPISRLIAEVTSPEGETLSVIERVAPAPATPGGSR